MRPASSREVLDDGTASCRDSGTEAMSFKWKSGSKMRKSRVALRVRKRGNIGEAGPTAVIDKVDSGRDSWREKPLQPVGTKSTSKALMAGDVSKIPESSSVTSAIE